MILNDCVVYIFCIYVKWIQNIRVLIYNFEVIKCLSKLIVNNSKKIIIKQFSNS